MAKIDPPISSAHEAALIRKLEAETEELQIQHELGRANIREQLAESEIREISLRERQRVEDLHMASDHYVFHHFIDGPVSHVAVFTALQVLAAWDRQYPECPMNITINSPGGSVVDGMHLFDQLTSYSRRGGGTHLVTITVRGYAASMAAILLQAADRRVVGPESYLLVHEISAGASGKIGEIKDDLKWYEKVCTRIANIFVERSGGRISADMFKLNWERKDWWLDSGESLELGFSDEIG